MLKKLVSIVALIALLVLGGCAQGQASPSAGALSGGNASTSADGQPVEVSNAAAGQSEEVSAETADATPSSESPSGSADSDAESSTFFVIGVDGAQLEVELADSDAARALVEQLQAGPVTVSLHAYGGFEKFGPLPWALPASDEQITTQPGDVMLYQGNQITVFTGSNSWAYTPLGRIEGATPESLLGVLGEGDVEAVLSLA